MFRDGPAQLIVFAMGAEKFAVQLSLLDEVIDLPAIQPMPDSPPSILGIATVHGALVTVYDARRVLNVGARLDGAVLLFTVDGRRVAIAVDDVHDAIVVDRSELLAAPGTGSDGVLMGVIQRDAELIAVLDGNALLVAAMAISQGEAR